MPLATKMLLGERLPRSAGGSQIKFANANANAFNVPHLVDHHAD